MVILGSELRLATQPYPGTPRWPPLWISRPPTPDSRRSLRRAAYPQLLHHGAGRDHAALPRPSERLSLGLFLPRVLTVGPASWAVAPRNKECDMTRHDRSRHPGTEGGGEKPSRTTPPVRFGEGRRRVSTTRVCASVMASCALVRNALHESKSWRVIPCLLVRKLVLRLSNIFPSTFPHQSAQRLRRENAPIWE